LKQTFVSVESSKEEQIFLRTPLSLNDDAAFWARIQIKAQFKPDSLPAY
jgi:hypothetical protein